jgi:response regulator RpfG family c-di-GMP phosphodiesterase
MNNTVLAVDDEPHILSSLKRALEEEPYDLLTATCGDEALRLLHDRKIQVVVSDEMMPGMRGSEFLWIVKERFPETVRILLTGQASIEATMRAVNNGEIYRFFTKPWNDVDLKLALRAAMEKSDLEAKVRRLLRVVKGQAGELSRLELRYPGITRLEKDDGGSLVLPDMTDEEMAEIRAMCGPGVD